MESNDKMISLADDPEFTKMLNEKIAEVLAFLDFDKGDKKILIKELIASCLALLNVASDNFKIIYKKHPSMKEAIEESYIRCIAAIFEK